MEEIEELYETVVSNNNDAQIGLNSLEEKMQEFEVLFSKSFDKSNQQLDHQKLVQKKEKPMDTTTTEKKCVDMLKDKSSISQLLDNFLFGSEEEKLVFESLCLKWKIEHKDIVIPKAGKHLCVSDTFPVYGFQLKAQLRLIIGLEETIELQLCFKDGKRKRQEMDIKPLPMVTFIIKDLSGQNKNSFSCCYCPFKCPLQINQYGYWSYSISNTKWNALVSPHDASMEVLVLVEPPTIINKPLSVNGTITDTIEHYSRKLEMAKERMINGHWGPPFLTHAGGFRVAVAMHLNWPVGINKSGISAVIRFLSGEFDSQLESEFEHETSVTLINQSDAKKNITVKKQAKEAYYYSIAIASDDQLCSGGFLVYDSLTYHVTIKPIK